MDPTRPLVHCLAGWPLEGGEVILCRQGLVSLEEAEALHALGFLVLIDPADEAMLTRWEQIQRSARKPRQKWKW